MQTAFAYLSASYLIASVVYLLSTYWLGTPFNDSLTKEQKKIKEEESCKRGLSFAAGVAVSVLLLSVWRPF